jgi:hypothetical protein
VKFDADKSRDCCCLILFVFLASSYFLGIPSHAAAAAAEIQNGKYQNKREKQTSFRLVLYLFGGCQFYTPPESLSLFSFHISFIDNELLLYHHEKQLTLCIALTLWHAELPELVVVG